MTWLRVTWTEAAHILPLCANLSDTSLPADMPPEQYFAQELLGQNRLDEAVDYLGAALPRLEVVQWATTILEKSGHAALPPHRKAMHAAVCNWLNNPSDSLRRAAWALATDDTEGSPEKLLASAVFFSGGSIAPEDCDPVQPEPHLCGRLAATAILACAYGSEDAESLLRLAAAEGDRIASS